MSSNHYSKQFKLKVVQEALMPGNEGMEHVIAKKYGIMPGTVIKWTQNYLEFGEDAFVRGFPSKKKRTPRERELEKKVADLEEEVKILKKAAAFLANVKHE